MSETKLRQYGNFPRPHYQPKEHRSLVLRNSEIRRLYEAGKTLQELGDEFGISKPRVHQIIHGRAGQEPKRRSR